MLDVPFNCFLWPINIILSLSSLSFSQLILSYVPGSADSRWIIPLHGQFGKDISLGLASFRVWRCCSQQLLHSLLMHWRQRWEAGTSDKLSQESSWESGGNSQSISKNRTLRKKVTAKFHCLWHSLRNPLKPGLMSSLHKSPLSQIHHLHCSFCVPFNWQNISPNQAYKNPAWLWCSDFRDEGRWGFLHQFFPRLSCLSGHMEKAIFLSNCFVGDAGSLLPLQPSSAVAAPCTGPAAGRGEHL